MIKRIVFVLLILMLTASLAIAQDSTNVGTRYRVAEIARDCTLGRPILVVTKLEIITDDMYATIQREKQNGTYDYKPKRISRGC